MNSNEYDFFEEYSNFEIFSKKIYSQKIDCNDNQVYNHNKMFSLQNYNSGIAQSCISCGKTDCLIEDPGRAEITCTSCGIVNENRMIFDGADWANYEDTREAGKDNSRVGWQDQSNPHSTLGSFIPRNTWVEGTDKNGKKYKYDLSKTHMIVSADNKERAFYEVIKIFDRLVYNSSVTQRVIDQAKLYWSEIVKSEKIFRGGNRNGLLACCILYACYQKNCSRTRDEIAEYMKISKDDIIKGEPIFQDIISKNVQYKHIIEQGHNVNDMFSPIIAKLGLPYKYYVPKCLDIYKQCEDELSEISTSSAIGGVVSYVVHVLKKNKTPTKKELLEIVGITNPTLSNAIKIIKNTLN